METKKARESDCWASLGWLEGDGYTPVSLQVLCVCVCVDVHAHVHVYLSVCKGVFALSLSSPMIVWVCSSIPPLSLCTCYMYFYICVYVYGSL